MTDIVKVTITHPDITFWQGKGVAGFVGVMDMTGKTEIEMGGNKNSIKYIAANMLIELYKMFGKEEVDKVIALYKSQI